MSLADLPAWRVVWLLTGGLLIAAMSWVGRRFKRSPYIDLDEDRKRRYRLASTIDRGKQ